MQALHYPHKKKYFILLFFMAFLIRAITFYFFISPGGYFKQPDSIDYHNCAISIAYGSGMHYPDTNEPIFWRTPAYPWYLSWFYNWFGLHSADFNANKYAQQAALWLQIFLSSFIPIIIFYLAFNLTKIYSIAWLTAGISVFHLGLVLSSTFLLTESLSLIFFYLFLLFFYTLFFSQSNHLIYNIIVSALILGIYTWIRPMGEFVGIVSAGMLFFLSPGTWLQTLKKTFLFFTILLALLSPWYIRNYNLTNECFFCPLSGVYLNAFNAPKILRHLTGKPLLETWQYTQQTAALANHQEKIRLAGTGQIVSPNIAKKIALPIIWAHPLYFIYDWAIEVIKTTFDLYASQLTVIAAGTYYYDPLEEYLPEKIRACLYTQQMPIFMRLICWLEFLFSIFLWIGLFSGSWLFLIKPFFIRLYKTKKSLFQSKFEQQMTWLWLISGLMIGAVLAMTGGFGYARLRLPIEPLMIILSLTFWLWLYNKLQNKKSKV